uniref:MYND-type domain-containing protein n=1 Tax=Mycena chlorophos TaxID=658473 RepID=A0ABQ0LCD5_MYCCL|nr:predicted protein [Mycena chlorophos]
MDLNASRLPQPSKDHCFVCKKPPAEGTSLQRCSRCRSVPYCSRECQAKDWKAHKEVCMIFIAQNAADDTSTTFGKKGKMKKGRENLRSRGDIVRDLNATSLEHNENIFSIVVWHAFDLFHHLDRARENFLALTLTRKFDDPNPRSWYTLVDAMVLPLSILDEKCDAAQMALLAPPDDPNPVMFSPRKILRDNEADYQRRGAVGACLMMLIEVGKKEKARGVEQVVRETSCFTFQPLGIWESTKQMLSVLPPTIMSQEHIWKACLRNGMDGYAYSPTRAPVTDRRS